MASRVVVGVDVGQQRDPTAMCVVSTEIRATGRPVHDKRWHLTHPLGGCREAPYCMDAALMDHFVLRTWGRLPLGTGYPEVGRQIALTVARLNDDGVEPWVVIDVTGVGRPVFDYLAEQHLETVRCSMTAATFVAGDLLDGGLGSSKMTVGKSRMVSRLRVLLADRRIDFPKKDRRVKDVIRELEAYEIHVSEAGLLQAAARTGSHDDLVTSLGLATLFDPSSQVVRIAKSRWLA